MRVINDDGTEATPAQVAAYLRDREIGRVRGAASWLWEAVKAAVPTPAEAIRCAAIIVILAFFTGHLAMPTSGCSLPAPSGCTLPAPTPPVPPNPGPTPTPAPIPVAGFRVLIVEDSTNRTKLPPAQQAVLFAKPIRDYLDAKCVVGADGKTHEWRIWDQGTDAGADGEPWASALKRTRQSLPSILISDGKTGFEGPLPATVAETLALLKKYGG
jgi:hypothetical protein